MYPNYKLTKVRDDFWWPQVREGRITPIRREPLGDGRVRERCLVECREYYYADGIDSERPEERAERERKAKSHKEKMRKIEANKRWYLERFGRWGPLCPLSMRPQAMTQRLRGFGAGA